MHTKTTEALRAVRHVALDLDGTIYTGNQVFDCAGPFLDTLKQLGIGYTFLTNNSSRNNSDYVAHLRKMGITAGEDEIFTSGDATIEYLCEEMPEVKRVFALGTESFQKQLRDAGYTSCGEHPDDVPDAVIVGFDTSLSYERLCRAAFWIEQGVPYLATHPDRVCPTSERNVLLDCGSICAALESATGRTPKIVPGKPNPLMLRGILRKHHLAPSQLAMVGDRLYTDMTMAHQCGILGILVLTGETKSHHVQESELTPEVIAQDLSKLGHLLQTTWRVDHAERTTPRHPTTKAPAGAGRRHV